MNIEERTSRVDFIRHFIPELIQQCVRKIKGRANYCRKKYEGKPILFDSSANELIFQMLQSKDPFMAARFGDGELRILVFYILKKLGYSIHYPEQLCKTVCTNAGFFPNTEEAFDQFGEIMLNSCECVDILAVWFNLMEEYVYKRFGPQCKKCISPNGLEPFLYEKPWSRALAGKKVLVIHPFAETIEEQYQKRQHLFENQDILPNFDLMTLKAVQTIGGKSERFNDWFEALDYMYKQAMEYDFDIAIIGCGAYGFPLAAKIKTAGKSAIHMGGVTQFLFGIKGKRWDNKPNYARYYNEFWRRPKAEDKPKAADQVENACYW